jgi:hypothetical protein
MFTSQQLLVRCVQTPPCTELDLYIALQKTMRQLEDKGVLQSGQVVQVSHTRVDLNVTEHVYRVSFLGDLHATTSTLRDVPHTISVRPANLRKALTLHSYK